MDRTEIQKWIESVWRGLKESPGVENIVAVEEYLMKLRSCYATLVNYFGQLEAERAMNLAAVVDQIDDDTFRKIRNSSTLMMKYAESSDPELTKMYYTIKQLISLMEQTSDEYRTLISYRKSELERHLA